MEELSELQTTLKSSKEFIATKVNELLSSNEFYTPKDLKDLASIVISVENSLKDDNTDGQLQRLLNKYNTNLDDDC